MARFCRSRAGVISRLFNLLLSANTVAALLANTAIAQTAHDRPADELYEYPTIIADPGVHTGVIRSAAVDSAGAVAVTGSEDKTVRVWSLSDGAPLQTIRMPAGPGPVGKVFAVALSPHGDLIAAGGWTSGIAGKESIYLFDRFGSVRKRIAGLPDVVIKLAFSTDARYLAAALGDHSLRIYDGGTEWSEVFRDTDYEDEIYGVAFAADGRVATASHDGKVRLYDSGFRLIVPPKEMTSGKKPHQIAFNPTENKLAVGYADVAVVDILAGDTLQAIGVPNTEGLSGALPHVAWSRDGKTLFAGIQNVHAWSEAGYGQHRVILGGNDTLMSLNPLPDGGVLIATADPLVRRFRDDGRMSWEHRNRIGDLGNRSGILKVSYDGTVVDFGFEGGAKAQLRFDVRERNLIRNPPDDGQTALPKQDGVQIERRGERLFLQGQLVRLDVNEKPRLWAVSPDARRVVIGGAWSLSALDANNQRLWRRDWTGADWRDGMGAVWAVNIAGNGRLVVAAYDDGTVRWHEIDTGQELLALMVLPTEKMDWVAWTPEGFYDATTEAFGVLQWHINHGLDAAGTTVRVSDTPRLKRPDVLALALREGGVGAFGLWEARAAREEAQKFTGSPKPPGARLHLLAIGVSQYGDLASRISLKFADKDADGVAAALVETQGINSLYRGSGHLYAEVKPTLLTNSGASRKLIFTKLAAMERMMADNDTAIIMFSGHGVMIGKRFYLLPYDADTTDVPGSIRASGISTAEFLEAIAPLTRRGRVLVLIDACHAGAFVTPNADELRGIIGLGGLTVLASSMGTQASREDPAWQHGAFTKIFLEALSASPDSTVGPRHRGVMSMNDLISYMAKKLPSLTGNAQELVVKATFEGDLFIVGM